MPYQKMQDLFLREAEQTFLDVIQAGYCNDDSSRNIWNKVLSKKQIRISRICIRKPYSDPEDAVKGSSSSKAENAYLLPAVAPCCEYSEHMQGFWVYMDRQMFDLCYDEQMILACLILIAIKDYKEYFKSICKHSSMHELYKANPAIHSTVITISQALKKSSAV